MTKLTFDTIYENDESGMLSSKRPIKYVDWYGELIRTDDSGDNPATVDIYMAVVYGVNKFRNKNIYSVWIEACAPSLLSETQETCIRLCAGIKLQDWDVLTDRRKVEHIIEYGISANIWFKDCKFNKHQLNITINEAKRLCQEFLDNERMTNELFRSGNPSGKLKFKFLKGE